MTGRQPRTGGKRLDVCMCGTGEYTTGFVHVGGSQSDKKIGVVALCMFELRRLGYIGNIKIAGTTGKKYPQIRQHLHDKIHKVYNNLDVTMETFPADDVDRDPLAYQQAIASMPAGSLVTIFTPDDTHFDIAKFAIERGMHVLVTKPAVKYLEEHRQLVDLAEKHGVIVQVEFHKRWDPTYADARFKSRSLGDFSYFQSFMSQPKFQLDTFKAWAGRSSDISYYLNSHHIDFHCWCMQGIAEPVSVVASGATGIASAEPYGCPFGTEDTITLMVQWRNLKTSNVGTALYTASWAAPKADVHSQQRFHLMCHQGEVQIDQAHRGYTICTDTSGFASVNPLYMSYTPSEDGNFAGHHGYGFLSIEAYVQASVAHEEMDQEARASFRELLHARLPTLRATLWTTAILHAGRRSLDNRGRRVNLRTDAQGQLVLEDE